jgi:hypothetical protein
VRILSLGRDKPSSFVGAGEVGQYGAVRNDHAGDDNVEVSTNGLAYREPVIYTGVHLHVRLLVK